jgi:hypothetical protein
MALLAGRILFGNGVWSILAKANCNGFLAATSFHVSPSRAMARLASAGLELISGMLHYLAHDGIFEAAFLILVASNACGASDVVAISSG